VVLAALRRVSTRAAACLPMRLCRCWRAFDDLRRGICFRAALTYAGAALLRRAPSLAHGWRGGANAPPRILRLVLTRSLDRDGGRAHPSATHGGIWITLRDMMRT